MKNGHGLGLPRLLAEGDDLVVRLPWWQKAAARHGDVRVPLAAVRRVVIEHDWWRALRGVARRGVWIPGGLYVGIRRLPRQTDFVAFRPGGPVVCLEAGPDSPYRLLSVSVAEPESVARWLRARAPDLDPRGTGRYEHGQPTGWPPEHLALWPAP
ncbi:hypothetical protein HCC61_14405 [Streptomyces sp. HNM0575]|uniref:hypothetical protein n=1 Tax=Streptomyces sp. HNM0575 TaxID=2716338 RepID=UPI00145D7018|nr:hypothetical protein [Streptomyces sp. HNM0575]NLU73856.1 hypothetical protein [Streptomyces sp. HNM0575]